MNPMEYIRLIINKQTINKVTIGSKNNKTFNNIIKLLKMQISIINSNQRNIKKIRMGLQNSKISVSRKNKLTIRISNNCLSIMWRNSSNNSKNRILNHVNNSR